MDDPTLEQILKTKYDLCDTIVAEGTFAILRDYSKNAVGLTAIAITKGTLILAKLVLGNAQPDYDLTSITPLSLVRISIQNYDEKIISVSSDYRGFQIFQLCSCVDQETVWNQFVIAIEAAAIRRKDVAANIQMKHHATNSNLCHTLPGSGNKGEERGWKSFPADPLMPPYVPRTRSLCESVPNQSPNRTQGSYSTPSIPGGPSTGHRLQPVIALPKVFNNFNRKYTLDVFDDVDVKNMVDSTNNAGRGNVSCNNSNVHTVWEDVPLSSAPEISSVTADSSNAGVIGNTKNSRDISADSNVGGDWSIVTAIKRAFCCMFN